MFKNSKIIMAMIVVVASIAFVTIGFASDVAEKIGLQDYIDAHSQGNSLNLDQGETIDMNQDQSFDAEKVAPVQVEGLTLSSFFIPISMTLDSEGIKSYEGNDLTGMLTRTDEKLWFIMNGEEPEGIVVANDTAPIKMGGINRSKDLMKVYKMVKKEVKKEDEIQYFEFEGQGVFVAEKGKKESVYLSESAAQILNLKPGKKLSSSEVLEKIKDYMHSREDN